MTILWKHTERRLSALLSRAKQLYTAVHGAIREVPFIYAKRSYTVVRHACHLHVYDSMNRKVCVRRL